MIGAPRKPQPFATLPRGLAPLGFRDYALYWVGFATTNVGRWVELTGLVWIVYELTSSATLLGLIGVARAVPVFLLSPIAGVIADRVDQRRLLFVTQGLALLASLILGILIAAGIVELWHIYLQVVLQAGISAFDAAARQALFPRLVPRELLAKAVTLTITAARVAKVIGPATGGVLIADVGTSAPFLLNAVSFLGLMAAVAAMHSLGPGLKSATTFRNELGDGFRQILRSPVLSGILKLEIVYGFFDMNPVMIAIIAREVLDVGPRELGLLLSAPAIGSIAGLSYLLMWQVARPGRFSLSCTLAFAGVLVLLAVSRSYAFSFAALMAIGFLDVMVTVSRHSIAQMVAPEHMRGRVMANLGTVTRGIGPLAETQSGILATALGPPLAIATAAAVFGVAAGATALFNRALWDVRLDQHSMEADSDDGGKA